MTEKTIEKIASAPSLVLESGVEVTKKLGKDAVDISRIKDAQRFWTTLGPGLTTGAADDDPSGIATYSQTGAQYGFQLLWLAGFTFPLMALVQEMCARIGLTTGRGLAGNIRINYPKWVLYLCTILLFIANTFNIGADIGAMAKATQLIIPSSNFILLTLFFTLFSLFLQIFTPYEHYARYLKWLVLVLFSYIISAFLVQFNINDLLKGTFIPSITISKEQIFLITGILGTTISPYLFFWQTSQEIEEEISRGKTTIRLREGAKDHEIKHMRIDVWTGMFVSNVVMYFIIAACAATLFTHGVTNIQTAADAALALKPFAGEYAYLLFTLGIIGAGLLAIPVLAGSAAYTAAESFNWRSGLYRKLHEARAFYGIIIFSMLIGLGIDFLNIDPIKVLLYSAVLNGLVAPVILFLIVQMASSKKVVKERTSHPVVAALGWLITAIMAIAGVATIISMFS